MLFLLACLSVCAARFALGRFVPQHMRTTAHKGCESACAPDGCLAARSVARRLVLSTHSNAQRHSLPRRLHSGAVRLQMPPTSPLLSLPFFLLCPPLPFVLHALTGKTHTTHLTRHILTLTSSHTTQTTTTTTTTTTTPTPTSTTINLHTNQGGHYSAHALQPDGRWLHFNDASVAPASPRQVLAEKAYVLAYEREA